MISVAEYRKILKDEVTDEELIKKRINYIEALCRTIIRTEIEKYVKSKEAKTEYGN